MNKWLVQVSAYDTGLSTGWKDGARNDREEAVCRIFLSYNRIRNRQQLIYIDRIWILAYFLCRRTFPSVWYSSFSLRSCEHYITIEQHSMHCVKFPKPARRNVSPVTEMSLWLTAESFEIGSTALCAYSRFNRTNWFISVDTASWVKEKHLFSPLDLLSYKQTMAIQMSSELYVPGSI